MLTRLFSPDAPGGGGAAAPAAPAPAAGAPAAPAAPAAPKGTADLIGEARARLAKGEPLVPPAKPADPPAGGEGGKPADPPAKPADPATPPAGELAPAKPGAEGDAGGEGEDGKGEESKFVVKLPPGREGEKELELELPDEETFNRVNRWKNGYNELQGVKGVQQEIQRDREEITDIEDRLAVDPAGFLLDSIPVETRENVARNLLFDPEVWPLIEEDIRKSLESEEARELISTRAAKDRLEMKDTLRERATQRRDRQKNARAIMVKVDSLIPKEFDGTKRAALFRDAVGDVQKRLERLGVNEVDPEDVILMVAARFREHGIDLRAIAGGGAPAPAAPAPGKPAAGGGAQPTAEELRRASDRRKAAAATAPAGAGAPAAKPRPELPATTQERIDLARKIGIRAMLGKT